MHIAKLTCISRATGNIGCPIIFLSPRYRNFEEAGNPVCSKKRFLLGTGRMPHPVGGAMGVTLCHCREKGIPRFDITLNIHKTTSRWYCMAVVLRPRLLTFACLAWHPANCSTALPKVFSSDLPVCQCTRTHMLVYTHL